MLKKIIGFFLDNRFITVLVLVAFIVWGIISAPFGWDTGFLPGSPVFVDAIPDIGENQQIVSTEWMGRSPRDVEDQVTYPLTAALLGVPGVQTVRSTSMFGMSFIYLIFDENVDFYWSRARITEKLNSLPAGTLPKGVSPSLGPDATALGQIFWYTLEGRNPETGEPAGGWDPHELRTIQDYHVRYALSTAGGVSEVASIGGFVREYQADINPEALRAHGVTIMDVMNAVKNSNLDIGAETIELNKVEYIIRGLGYLKSIGDLEQSVVAVRNNIPVKVGDVAKVSFGPAARRGGLDKSGAEAVGAVVVARHGANPMEVINNVKDKIEEISVGMPAKTLSDGTVSKVTIVPFYDRSGLIRETIGTLYSALTHEILISIIVIIVLVLNLRASILISGMLPIAVLMTFIAMKLFGVDANIVALSGIAIAIGVMVDVGIVLTENILRHLEAPENKGAGGRELRDIIYCATIEVLPALITAMLTTIVSFLPVFAMQAAEGKLFRPLAFTKTFALLASLVIGLIALPALAHFTFGIRNVRRHTRVAANVLMVAAGVAALIFAGFWPALALSAIGINNLTARRWPAAHTNMPKRINIAVTLLFAVFFLSREWLPLGAHNSFIVNFLFVAGIIALVLVILTATVRWYEHILRWCLTHKWQFLMLPALTVLLGAVIWLGFDRVLGFVAKGAEGLGWNIRQTSFWSGATHIFPGTGKEFMPSLDEGSFLLMPTSMPHTGIEQNIEYVRELDKRLSLIPEVDVAVGKWGRVNSALDPAPVQMFENTINYRPEYVLDNHGRRMKFKVDREGGFVLADGSTYNRERDGFRIIDSDLLVPAKNGEYFRQWRDEIRSPDDIWKEIINVSQLPGLTSAPKLQPIETRQVMLSTGMRAPMGLKVYGPDLETIEKAGTDLERVLRDAPGVLPSSVFYDRSVSAPYVQIKLDREAMARYGMTIAYVQEVLETAVGGMTLTTAVEGRERYPVRVRYPRELRSSPDDLNKILMPAADGSQIPLGELASIDYEKGPQMIRSENTFLTGYVIFDKQPFLAEVDVVEDAETFLRAKIASGELKLPPGITYRFAGNYEQQVRAMNRLSVIIPVTLIIVFLLLYFQFKTFTASSIHFSGVFVAFAGGFIMLWLYGQSWFMDFSLAGVNMRELFQIHTVNLSVAVWVGFIALFGIATDDGVLMGTYIHQVFEKRNPATVEDVREAVVEAGKKRVRPAMMTTATTIIALLPVLTSSGKGSDIMVPMAIPAFGGMIIQTMTIFVVPVFQSIWRERAIKQNKND